jgi:hypothetical protein
MAPLRSLDSVQYFYLPEIYRSSLGLLSGTRDMPNSLPRISLRTCKKREGGFLLIANSQG